MVERNTTDPSYWEPFQATYGKPAVDDGGVGGAGGGSFWDSLGSTSGGGWGSLLGTGLAGAGLGYLAFRGPGKATGSERELGALTRPFTAAAEEEIGFARSGQLTPSDQAALERSRSEADNAVRQQFYRMGVTSPEANSSFIGAEQDINQRILAQRQEYINQYWNHAMQAAGLASRNLSDLASKEWQRNTAFTNALATALGAFGKVVGRWF